MKRCSFIINLQNNVRVSHLSFYLDIKAGRFNINSIKTHLCSMEFVTRPTRIYIHVSSNQNLISYIKFIALLIYLRFISWYVLLRYDQHRNTNDSKDESPKKTRNKSTLLYSSDSCMSMGKHGIEFLTMIKKTSNNIIFHFQLEWLCHIKNIYKCKLWFSQWNSAFQKCIELW